MNTRTTTARSAGGTAPRDGQPGLYATAAVVVLGSLMSVVDTTVVTTALPSLARQFHAPLAQLQFVSSGYTLALATVIPVTAWGIARFGAKRLYLTALVVFALGSALAGLAWDLPSLVAFRVVQGLGGGLLMPVGMTLVIRAAGGERTGRAMSLMGIPVLIGPLAGPPLGGWLVDTASWHWAFFVNLPVAAVAVPLAARLLASERPTGAGRLDITGLLLLSPGLALLVYGLSRHGAPLPTVAGAALTAWFARHALRAERPLLDLRLLAQRRFAAAVGAQVLFVAAYFGSMILLPLYYQGLRGFTPTHAGLLGVPQALATGITMQLSGRLADRVPAGRIVPVGIGLAATGFLAFTLQVTADVPVGHLQLAQVVMGVGVGLTMMPNLAGATREVAPAQVPMAATTLNILQQVAATAGTALLGVLLAAAAGAGPGAVPDADGFRHTYGWAVALMAAALLPALLLPRGRRDGPRGVTDQAGPSQT
ncbi:DHA2 family efflux MFS transporter permease subunit [Streptacidiphilus monticola]|uniref:DHA2 family efflux MFS transporter permease subunit n=1 Tax=Streptacidiphilus monticola TaxID=2161674 RepID=A0ABW1G5P1_9ACTN